jgi:hypothetical protein
MSQYALYLKKKKLSGSTRFLFYKKSKNVHNGYELDKVFGIKEEHSFIDRILYVLFLGLDFKKLRFISRPMINLFGLFGCRVIREDDNYNFQPAILPTSRGITFYAGGWHSEKYFSDIRDSVRKAFRFDTDRLGTRNWEMLERIRSCTSVSVHVRRGDFLDANNYRKFGSVCTLRYFQCAIQKIRPMVDNPHFFFFTNDHDWVRENFAGNDCTIVDINAGRDSWKDMFLISSCAHHINSNGTFSWWSSWLNEREDKLVIVPKNFIADQHFEDIYPAGWIQLSDY